MAGIAGVFLKDNYGDIDKYGKVFKRMLSKLSISNEQKHNYHFTHNFLFGNVIPVYVKKNECFVHNKTLNIFVIIEGLVFVDENEKILIYKKYNIQKDISDYELLSYLYDHYDSDIINHLTGWYNIFIYNPKNNKAILFNDRLGYLPLYYYESDLFFIFASKIECLLISGLLPKIDFDRVTMVEHFFFNYPLSDFTYIKNINTLTNASIVFISRQKIIKHKYWNFGDLFDNEIKSEKESLDQMDFGLKKAINKIISYPGKEINFSLTGGWDSRVVLSYFLPEYKERLHLYSFGSIDSDDIRIPKHIAEKEQLKYTPFILDQTYLENEFLLNAKKTIELSNGTRNYKRTHYLYSIKKIASGSNIQISGIFGDEVFKIAQAVGGSVLSENTINLLKSNFNIELILKQFSNSIITNMFDTDFTELRNEFAERLILLKNYMNQFKKLSRKYYVLRFEINLRKYFGNEVNSYNDYVYCYSPFIDYDFLNNFSHTKFFGSNYPFNSNTLKLKKQSTLLYYNITQRNYKPLIYYNSARGFSMKDATSLKGYLRIFKNKFLKNKSIHKDDFNTNSTNNIFNDFIKSLPNNLFTSLPGTYKNYKNYADISSLYYWTYIIASKYLL